MYVVMGAWHMHRVDLLLPFVIVVVPCVSMEGKLSPRLIHASLA